MFNKQKILLLIKILLFAILAMPLIVDAKVIFPFIFTKVIYFRVLVDLAFIFYLILVLKYKEYLPCFNFFTISASLFLLLAIIVSYFGVDWNFSFWGGHERMDGLFSLLHYFIFTILLITIFGEKDWYIFLRSLLVVSIFVLLKGFYEAQTLGVSRVSGTLGNPIYFGEYSLFLFWFSILFSFLTKIKWERYSAYALAFLSILGIFVSGSRGPFLSLVLGLAVFSLFYIFIAKNKQIKFSFLGIIIIGIFLVLGGIFSPENVLIKNIPIVNNLSDIKNLGETVSNRILAADIALESFKERPLGWGFANFSTAFHLHYKAEFLRRGWGDTFFDSAHNYYLDILVGLGILGVASFLSIFVLAIIKLIREIKQSQYKIFFSLLLALVISILAQLFFSFLHPAFYFWLFLSLAFVVYASYGHKQNEIEMSQTKIWLVNILALLLIVFSLWSLFYGNIKTYQANRLDDKVRVLIQYRNIVEAMELTEDSLDSMGPMHREIVRDYIKYWIGASVSAEQKEDYVSLLYSLEERVDNNLQNYNPNNTFDYLFLLRVNIILNIFEDRTKKIESVFARASQVSDKKQELNFLYFNYLIQEERIDEAKSLMEKIINDDPELYYGYWYLAKIYIFLGDIELAYDYYQKAVDRGFLPGEDDQGIVDLLLDKID
ncbi:O-antigen ligase family protein [Patescibacteria group bacterium]|nr:O-antigen ligase family protein [Patescibacteria group bacterium]